MHATITYRNRSYHINLAKPVDISVPLRGGKENVTAWYLDPPRIDPHLLGDTPGRVAAGAAVNFNDIWFNPHSHGTHTECVGHISRDVYSVNQLLKGYFFMAVLITIAPERKGGDAIITASQLKEALGQPECEAVLIRTLPNTEEKLHQQYSNTNPAYLDEQAAAFLATAGVEHLLVDLPSIDKEKDGGTLRAHRAFWNFDGPLRMGATITEFIYVPDRIPDGLYFLDLQVAPFENDASPSRPVLYQIIEK